MPGVTANRISLNGGSVGIANETMFCYTPTADWPMCAVVYVCMQCPEWCITPSPSPSSLLSVCVLTRLCRRNADPAHKINGCCFLSFNNLLLSAAHIVVHETLTHKPCRRLYDPSPFAAVTGSHTNPQEIGLNYKSVTLNWKKYGSVGVCSRVFSHLKRLEWDLHRCSCHRSAKFIITPAIYTVLCQQIKQGNREHEWNIIRLPLCCVALAKWPTSVYLACPFYFRHMDKIKSIFTVMQVSLPFFLSLSLSLSQTHSS